MDFSKMLLEAFKLVKKTRYNSSKIDIYGSELLFNDFRCCCNQLTTNRTKTMNGVGKLTHSAHKLFGTCQLIQFRSIERG